MLCSLHIILASQSKYQPPSRSLFRGRCYPVAHICGLKDTRLFDRLCFPQNLVDCHCLFPFFLNHVLSPLFHYFAGIDARMTGCLLSGSPRLSFLNILFWNFPIVPPFCGKRTCNSPESLQPFLNILKQVFGYVDLKNEKPGP